MTKQNGMLASVVVGLLCLGVAVAAPPAPETGKTYTDSRGVNVVFPQGDASFARQVGNYTIGDPPPTSGLVPAEALGPPNNAAVCLGCGGQLVLKFDYPIVDIEGPDLYVFEVGPAIEPTAVSISVDGQSWIPVEEASGGTAAVNIASAVQRTPHKSFYYVMLRDLRDTCGGQYSGADIDSVGAIGTRLCTFVKNKRIPPLVQYEGPVSALPEACQGVFTRNKRIPAAVQY
jgi:OmpA-OmpF porin, OOP family